MQQSFTGVQHAPPSRVKNVRGLIRDPRLVRRSPSPLYYPTPESEL